MELLRYTAHRDSEPLLVARNNVTVKIVSLTVLQGVQNSTGTARMALHRHGTACTYTWHDGFDHYSLRPEAQDQDSGRFYIRGRPSTAIGCGMCQSPPKPAAAVKANAKPQPWHRRSHSLANVTATISQ